MFVESLHRAGVGAFVAAVCAVAFVGLPHVLVAQGAPQAPTNLSATVQGSTVELSWSPAAGAVGYQLEAGSVRGAADLVVTTVMVPGLVANNVPNGRYWVRVRSGNAAGLSAPSNEISVRVGCLGPPAAPTGLSANAAGNTVTITWQGSAGAASYVLEAGSASGAADLAAVPLGAPGLLATAPYGAYYLRVRALNACGSSGPSAEVRLEVGGAGGGPTLPTPLPPPSGSNPIFGSVDPVILGTCSAAVHDLWTIDGRDGFRYRTWHPQVDPTGCVYAHEHGDNPAMTQNAEIAAVPVKFGHIGRRHPMPGEPNGHDEPHEGFKVFIANPGDRNDEGRVNRVYSRSVFHMGTGGPKRFTMQHHSAEIRVIHPEFGLKAFTQLMMDTGGSANVCNPRVNAPTKDVVQLNSPCQLTSAYEIWGTTQAVRINGREAYRSFATPAVFDPITVRNPANAAELVYAWDPRMAGSKVHNADWSRFRGCERESYAQPGYWDNSRGSETYYTDPMGNQVAATSPYALLQVISRSQSVGAPATTDGQHQFKMRRNYCQQWSRLGLKN
ncbi:MAG: fibronectin type III domain-containing protein [Vicinamibacterales bacterium]